MKTLPFAECTISDYTFLSQASNEQGKAHASIAIVPLFLCRYSFLAENGDLELRQAGLGNIFRP